MSMLEPPPVPSNAAPPGLARESSLALVDKMQKKTKAIRKRFLIATLNQEQRRKMPPPSRIPRARNNAASSGSGADGSEDAGADPEISDVLVDKRGDFLFRCVDSHWQFDELRRAHYSTMMIMAHLGGMPNNQDTASSNPFAAGASS